MYDGITLAGAQSRGDALSLLNGVNYFYWSAGQLVNATSTLPLLNGTKIAAEIDFNRFKLDGFDLIAIPVFVNQSSADSNDPHLANQSNDKFGSLGADYLDYVGQLVDKARDMGFKVCIRIFNTYGDWGWRGNINPSDPNTWFANFENIVTIIAQWAENKGVYCLEVASELNKLFTSTYDADWNDLVNSISSVYNGRIVMTVNWDRLINDITGSTSDVLYSTFTNTNLDAIGIAAYFPLTTNPDPTLDELKDAWDGSNPENLNYTQRLLDVRDFYDKPLIFMEVGYRSVDGYLDEPFDYTSNLDAEQDELEQSLAFYTLIWESLRLNSTTSVNGGFWGYVVWGAATGLPYHWDGYDVWAKHAERVIAYYQGGQLEPGYLRLVDPDNTTSIISLFYDDWMIQSSEYGRQPKPGYLLEANLSFRVKSQSSSDGRFYVSRLGFYIDNQGYQAIIKALVSSNSIVRLEFLSSIDGWQYHYVDLSSTPINIPVTGFYLASIRLSNTSSYWAIHYSVVDPNGNVVAGYTLDTGMGGSLTLDFDYFYVKPYDSNSGTIWLELENMTVRFKDKIVLAVDYYYHLGYIPYYISLETGGNVLSNFYTNTNSVDPGTPVPIPEPPILVATTILAVTAILYTCSRVCTPRRRQTVTAPRANEPVDRHLNVYRLDISVDTQSA
ncbi:MAG: hypothetical protein F7C38_05420 [Desulfurococcales archaeon]|nr:hypothetical protein [Desulfurococcales archaeon]